VQPDEIALWEAREVAGGVAEFGGEVLGVLFLNTACCDCSRCLESDGEQTVCRASHADAWWLVMCWLRLPFVFALKSHSVHCFHRTPMLWTLALCTVIWPFVFAL